MTCKSRFEWLSRRTIIVGVLFAGSAAGCRNQMEELPIVEMQTQRPQNPKGFWRTDWQIQGELSGESVSCEQPGAAHVIAHIRDDDDRPVQRRRFRAPCDAMAKEAFVPLEPGRYRVTMELQSASGRTLSTTGEGVLVMPADGHPQSTPTLFRYQDGVVVKASNQR